MKSPQFALRSTSQTLPRDDIGGPTWSHPAFFSLPLPSQGRKQMVFQTSKSLLTYCNPALHLHTILLMLTRSCTDLHVPQVFLSYTLCTAMPDTSTAVHIPL